MRNRKLLVAAMAALMAASPVVWSTETSAQDKPAAPAIDPMAAPSTPKPIKIWPNTLAWGLSPDKLARVYDQVIDYDYKDDYQKVQPGIRMEELDAEVAEKKNQFRRSIVKFGNLPTGVDATPLKGEYSYKNKESMMEIKRKKGKVRHFFFIQDRLWKIVDVYTAAEYPKAGKDFTEFAQKLSKTWGAAGRVIEPNPAAGRFMTEIDWRDGSTHLRAVDWGGGKFALVYEDIQTLQNLDSLRQNKPEDSGAVDPAVAAALKEREQLGKPAEEEEKKKKP